MENFHTGGQDRDRPAAGLIEKWKSLNEMTALSQERKGEALGGWQVQSLSSRLSEMDRAGRLSTVSGRERVVAFQALVLSHWMSEQRPPSLDSFEPC